MLAIQGLWSPAVIRGDGHLYFRFSTNILERIFPVSRRLIGELIV